MILIEIENRQLLLFLLTFDLEIDLEQMRIQVLIFLVAVHLAAVCARVTYPVV